MKTPQESWLIFPAICTHSLVIWVVAKSQQQEGVRIWTIGKSRQHIPLYVYSTRCEQRMLTFYGGNYKKLQYIMPWFWGTSWQWVINGRLYGLLGAAWLEPLLYNTRICLNFSCWTQAQHFRHKMWIPVKIENKIHVFDNVPNLPRVMKYILEFREMIWLKLHDIILVCLLSVHRALKQDMETRGTDYEIIHGLNAV